MENNKPNRKVGALWIKEKNGKSFLTGEIIVNGNPVKVIAFKNTDKKNPKQPDWDILLSLPPQGIVTGEVQPPISENQDEKLDF